eukprot:1161287-Pelagomonas_calceolata.AAC.3
MQQERSMLRSVSSLQEREGSKEEGGQGHRSQELWLEVIVAPLLGSHTAIAGGWGMQLRISLAANSAAHGRVETT